MIRKTILILCTFGAFVVATTWIVGGGNTGYVIPAGSSSLVVAMQGRALGVYTFRKTFSEPFRASIYREEEGWVVPSYRIRIKAFKYVDPQGGFFSWSRNDRPPILTRRPLHARFTEARSFRIPLWLLAGLLAAYPLSVLIRRPFRRRRHRLRHNLCLGCGYPLFGLPSPTCPECGREFEQRRLKC